MKIDQTFSSREVEAGLSIARASLIDLSHKLPVTRSAGAGKARRWTAKDVIVIHLALRLNERGLSQAASIDIATAAEQHFADAIADSAQGKNWRLMSALQPDPMGRFEVLATNNPEAALDFIEANPGCVIINLSDMMRDAFALMAAYRQEPKGHA
ncbi:MAG: hypothetical protein K8H74_01355 [Notoacmeibacter sp.]|nr:hypothetical protein [Notoacmeibacter sp.]